MSGDISSVDHIYLVTGYTDMRRSIDGLCAIIEDQLRMDPYSNSLFLFCGKRRDRIKAILHEPDGMVLLYKRLTVRGHYEWPKNKTEVRDLTWRQFDWLMSGLKVDQPKALQTDDLALRSAKKASEIIDQKVLYIPTEKTSLHGRLAHP